MLSPFISAVPSPPGSLAVWVYALAGLVLVLIGLVVAMQARWKRERAEWESVLQDADGNSLAQMLREHATERQSLLAQTQDNETRIRRLENKVDTAKRFVGVHRYNAFEDVAGNQSFAVAVYDDQGHGFVMSSVVGRQLTRYYVKELKEGVADPPLSDEEQLALRSAIQNRERVSP